MLDPARGLRFEVRAKKAGDGSNYKAAGNLFAHSAASFHFSRGGRGSIPLSSQCRAGAFDARRVQVSPRLVRQREVKRSNRYDAVILDPPTYGHGPKGEPWKIGEHLLPLLRLCGELTANARSENRAPTT